jgi:hypothetical protein
MPLVLVAVLCVLWLLIVGHRQRLGLGALSVRGALVVAFLMFEVLLLVITEVTSIGGHFTSFTVGVGWGILLLLLLISARPLFVRLFTRWARSSGQRPTIRAGLRILGIEQVLWWTAILAVFGILAAIGWLYPPNNSDSMVYHLARVEHWIQNGSVAPYATHYLAQIELSPLHEYNLAHLHLLFGSDRLDGFVQLFAALICVIGASEMARLLGGSRWVQTAAAVLCITIPSGVLEATSTENNYFAAAIGVALLLLLMAWKVGRGWIPRAVGIGFAGGLVVLAKGTLLALIGPGAVVLALLALRKEWRARGGAVALRRCLAAGIIAIACAVAVAGPFELQNVQLFGSVLGPVSQSTVSTHLGPGAAAANIIRSTAGNFLDGGGPGGFQTDFFKVVLQPLQAAFSRLGVSPTDQNYAVGTLLDAFTVHANSIYSRTEEYSANPWHVLLLLLTGIGLVVAVGRGRRELRTPLVLAVGLCCGYLFFTATVKWGMFNVRYQLPLVVAWCPLIALVLRGVGRVAGRLVLVALLVACTPQLLDNAERSLLHPTYNFSSDLAPYFHPAVLGGDSGAPAAYESVTDSIAQSSCRKVGLANLVFIEYPLWVGVHDDGWMGTIEDVDVMNESQRLEVHDYQPCAWIRQEGPNYVAPNDGTVDLQFGGLALSVEAPQAGSISTRILGFASAVRGVRVLPGGGWSLEAAGGLGVMQTASLYLYADSPQRVGLVMRLVTATARPTVSVQDAAGDQIPVTSAAGLIELSVQLGPGVTPLRISSGAGSGATNAGLEISSVTVVTSAGLASGG